MPYKDPERRKASQLERSRRHKAKKHEAAYGPNAGDQRGKHGHHARGRNNARWNARARMLSEHGYVKVRVGRKHPLADPNGYAYEHLIVWAAAGRPLPGPGELIHHVDEDKTNNRIDNLELKTRSGHATHHNADRERDADGRFLPEKPAAAGVAS